MVKVTIYLKGGSQFDFKMLNTVAHVHANLTVKRKQGKIFNLETDRGSIVILDPYEIAGALIEKS